MTINCGLRHTLFIATQLLKRKDNISANKFDLKKHINKQYLFSENKIFINLEIIIMHTKEKLKVIHYPFFFLFSNYKLTKV